MPPEQNPVSFIGEIRLSEVAGITPAIAVHGNSITATAKKACWAACVGDISSVLIDGTPRALNREVAVFVARRGPARINLS